MNKELAEVIRLYTLDHKSLNTYLLGKSVNTLIALLTDLLTMYINDKNSSSIREYITVIVSGYEHSEGKLGYNGFKQDSIGGGKPLNCEAKPKNISSSRKKPGKLNGGGNFSDYTHARLEKDILANPNMLISGFIDGRLFYIFEFPFNHLGFITRLRSKLDRILPNGDEINKYLRSADFDFKNYADCPNLRIIYLISKDELDKNRNYFSREFFKFLKERSEHE